MTSAHAVPLFGFALQPALSGRGEAVILRLSIVFPTHPIHSRSNPGVQGDTGRDTESPAESPDDLLKSVECATECRSHARAQGKPP